ncbi:hypothetical protein BDN72DRAFT_906755 [Pluteus cervinus]|uniref:Uncharacterized protein n=1 Tax=Pluteus cervinus TaxID=181527 RepID=A0ACD3A0K1_9AGAR|nr:hypothetical protein BDN72DRAFT_906755 [Pluteus cervinus]
MTWLASSPILVSSTRQLGHSHRRCHPQEDSSVSSTYEEVVWCIQFGRDEVVKAKDEAGGYTFDDAGEASTDFFSLNIDHGPNGVEIHTFGLHGTEDQKLLGPLEENIEKETAFVALD